MDYGTTLWHHTILSLWKGKTGEQKQKKEEAESSTAMVITRDIPVSLKYQRIRKKGGCVVDKLCISQKTLSLIITCQKGLNNGLKRRQPFNALKKSQVRSSHHGSVVNKSDQELRGCGFDPRPRSVSQGSGVAVSCDVGAALEMAKKKKKKKKKEIPSSIH